MENKEKIKPEDGSQKAEAEKAKAEADEKAKAKADEKAAQEDKVKKEKLLEEIGDTMQKALELNLREKMEPYFKQNPGVNQFHVSSDETPFYSKTDAEIHQKSIDKEKEVLTINR